MLKIIVKYKYKRQIYYYYYFGRSHGGIYEGVCKKSNYYNRCPDSTCYLCIIELVFKNDSKDKQYTMEVYTTDGKLKFKENFNIPYTTIKLSGGNILMYNSSQMCVMNSRGVQKYLGSVDGTIKDFFKIGMNRYLLVLDSGVEVIKLS